MHGKTWLGTKLNDRNLTHLKCFSLRIFHDYIVHKDHKLTLMDSSHGGQDVAQRIAPLGTQRYVAANNKCNKTKTTL